MQSTQNEIQDKAAQDDTAIVVKTEGTIKVGVVSDTHSFTRDLKIDPVDLLIHCGDFSLRGTKEETQGFANWFKEQKATHRIVISGNHELTFDRTRYEERLQKFINKPAQLENLKKNVNPDIFIKYLTDIPGCTYLEHQSMELYGYKFFGTPFIVPVSDWAFMLKPDQRKAKFEEIPTDTEILITHQAPKGILDAKADLPQDSKYRYGCNFLKEEVLNRVKPLYHIFGHNHDGYGTTSIDGINFINAASVDEDYQQNHLPMYFELPFRKAEADPKQTIVQEEMQTQAV